MRAGKAGVLFPIALAWASTFPDWCFSAQPVEAAGAERQRGVASSEAADALPGKYKLDPGHASVVARILHEGTSYSTFRFHGVAGTLDWDPRVEASKIEVTVDPRTIVTPAEGFADTLRSDRWFNVAKFPQVRFVSTSVRQTGPKTGEIAGDLTLMGQTRPIRISAELIGIGASIRGVPTIGFRGATRFKRSDFGMDTLKGLIGDEVEMLIDVEFDRKADG